MPATAHEPKMYRTIDDRGERYWFECSCGWMGDEQATVYSASNRWQFHMTDIVHAQVREVVARAPENTVDI